MPDRDRQTMNIWAFDVILGFFLDNPENHFNQDDFLTADLVNFLQKFNPYQSLSISIVHWNHPDDLNDAYKDISCPVFSILSLYHTWIQTEVQFLLCCHTIFVIIN